MIVDSGVTDTDPLDLVREIISANAMVNTAVVSALPDQEFHNTGEGLGILCRLPLEPGKKEARDFASKTSGGRQAGWIKGSRAPVGPLIFRLAFCLV